MEIDHCRRASHGPKAHPRKHEFGRVGEVEAHERFGLGSLLEIEVCVLESLVVGLVPRVAAGSRPDGFAVRFETEQTFALALEAEEEVELVIIDCQSEYG